MGSHDAANSAAAYTPADQAKMLEEAIFFVKEQSYYMKKAIEMEDLSNSLKHGSNIISELRTSTLSPIHYYELYMKVFNELEYLADFVGDYAKKTDIISELYVSVQQATFILPRLYLLVMVGAHYIKSKRVTAKEILDDITELCKGVQHPMRGLFLRYYLVQICKDKLPDSEPDNEHGFLDSFEFLMNNFCESIRLWIRLNARGRDRERADKERMELGLLVGANLVRITQLDGVDISFYAETALPRILAEIRAIDDFVAQKYLLDCLIQAFSDEFHIQTIDEILAACVASVKSGRRRPRADDGISILITMMKRLSAFLAANPGVGARDAQALPEGVDIFATFQKHLATINVVMADAVVGRGRDDQGSRVGIKGYLDLQASFLEFTTALYPGVVEHVEFVLNAVVEALAALKPGVVIEGPPAQSIVNLLTIPIRTLSLRALELGYNEKLMAFLNFEMRKQMAVSLIDQLVKSTIFMDELSSFDVFFHFVAPLFARLEDLQSEPLSDSVLEAVKAEQHQICKLIQAIKCRDMNDQFAVYKDLAERIAGGGSLRMKYTLPCLVTCSLNLLFATLRDNPDPSPAGKLKTLKIAYNHELALDTFKFVHELTDSLQPISPDVGPHHAQETLKLLVLTSVTVDEFARTCLSVFGDNAKFLADMRSMCLNFLMRACTCFEDEVSGGAAQVQALKYIGSAVASKVSILEKDDYHNVAMLLAKYGLGLPRLQHRCEVLAAAAHLFSAPQYHNEQRLAWCLERCLAAVDACDYFAPGKLVEALLPALEEARYFKLKAVARQIQARLDQLAPRLGPGRPRPRAEDAEAYAARLNAIQEHAARLGK